MKKEGVDPGVHPFSPARVVLIGLGGIGSKLADELGRYMSHTTKAPKELLLVDGDMYSQSNLERQSILESDVGKPKAQVWSDGLAAEFHNLTVSAMCGYVGKEGTKKDNVVPIDRLPMEGAITIVAVDNHATRKLFSDWFQDRIASGVLISGGNEKTDGSMITAARIKAAQILPAIDTFHPEIKSPKDKNPADLSCAELAKIDGGTQVIWANQMIAALIGNEVHSVVTGEWEKLRKRGEVYFDILENAAVARQRLVSGKEVILPKEEETTKEVAKEAKSGKRKVAPKAAKGRKPVPAELKVIDERGSEPKVTGSGMDPQDSPLGLPLEHD